MPNMMIHWEWFLRIIIAGLCGAIIGYERRNRNKEAGIRTHAIIALSAVLIMVVSKYGFPDVVEYDAARMAAQIVSGVGFLGAGVIFVRHGTVSGLTTAAGIWATAGVGSCIGSGLYDVGILSTLFVVGLQFMFHHGILRKYANQGQIIQLQISQDVSALSDIQHTMKKYGIAIQSMKVEVLDRNTLFIEIDGVTPQTFNREELLEEMMNKNYMKMFSYA
ncbi:MgtC/SapB family protein [Longibaculum muris]|uniref:MgtC/SapB family protein n=1 Tax=Longibaculum muris TaxID=1796628 RepID=UPI0022E63A9F|nr:MgtC/SapB family protein [Longibaculum muris]